MTNEERLIKVIEELRIATVNSIGRLLDELPPEEDIFNDIIQQIEQDKLVVSGLSAGIIDSDTAGLKIEIRLTPDTSKPKLSLVK